MKRILFLLIAVAAILFSGCSKSSPEPFIAYIEESDAVVAGLSNSVTFVVDDGLNKSTLQYESALAKNGELFLIVDGMAAQAKVPFEELILYMLNNAEAIASSDGLTYLKQDGRVLLYSNRTLVESRTASFEADRLSAWKDTFLISEKDGHIYVYKKASTGTNGYLYHHSISNVGSYAVADKAPNLLYVTNGGMEVRRWNLYAGFSESLIQSSAPVRRIRYYEAQRLLVILGDGWLTVNHLDSGKIEMAQENALDACYDRNGNTLWLLTPQGILRYENVGDLLESAQTNEARFYRFESLEE